MTAVSSFTFNLRNWTSVGFPVSLRNSNSVINQFCQPVCFWTCRLPTACVISDVLTSIHEAVSEFLDTQCAVCRWANIVKHSFNVILTESCMTIWLKNLHWILPKQAIIIHTQENECSTWYSLYHITKKHSLPLWIWETQLYLLLLLFSLWRQKWPRARHLVWMWSASVVLLTLHPFTVCKQGEGIIMYL